MSLTVFIPGPNFFSGGSVKTPILGPNGSASAPTYSFSAHTGDGMYYDTTNSALAFSAGGVEAFYVSDSNQQVTFLQQANFNGPIALAHATIDSNGFAIPAAIDPSTYYFSYDWDWVGLTSAFTSGGNTGNAAVNATTAPLMTNSTQGVGYAYTTSTTNGGYLCLPASYAIVKSSAITYQWRELFYLPAASTSTNRYTAFIGGFVAILATSSSLGPFAGPYIAYSDNLNSGNWVMGSAMNNTSTTANSSVAAVPNSWNTLLITLSNGVYTMSVNGVSLGTLTDNNIPSSPANNCAASAGGVLIIPDGTDYTTQRTLMIDRSDYYVTGLTR